jgi:hypothetical protein
MCTPSSKGRVNWNRKCEYVRLIMAFPCRMKRYRLARSVLICALAPWAWAQQSPSNQNENGPPQDRDRALDSAPQPEPVTIPIPTSKRILWIIPNYRTYPSLKEYKSIPAKEKFHIALQDSFDPGTPILAAVFGGEGQLTHATPEFGQGVAGFARYTATSYADLVIGDYMTEAIFPTMLHQDPRYFRKGEGSGFSRLGYAVGQIFWTHGDRGGGQFNFSEIGGNSAAVGLSNLYNPGSHNASTAFSKLGLQIGVDMVSNILKEFWPDLDRKFARRHDIPTKSNP